MKLVEILTIRKRIVGGIKCYLEKQHNIFHWLMIKVGLSLRSDKFKQPMVTFKRAKITQMVRYVP